MSQPLFNDSWRWSKEMSSHLRYPFLGIETLTENFSQAWQDIFVLMMHKGQRDGSYLEVGGHSPSSNNNTYLLHRQFGWNGVTLELDPSHFPTWKQERPDCTLVIANALTIDYADALPRWFGSERRRIDYLQLDIDPSINTLGVLKRLPLDDWRFSVITFETDAYTGDYRAREESRAILLDLGYILIARDVSVLYPPVSPVPIQFEDWWLDSETDLIDADQIKVIQEINSLISTPQSFLFH